MTNIPRKEVDYKLIESLAALGLDQKSIALAAGWDDHAFSAHKMKDKKMQESIDKGRSRAITDVGYSLMNKACGAALWEKDPDKRARNLGKGGSEKILVYMDQKLTGVQTQKIEVSGPDGAPILVKSLAQLMGLGVNDEVTEQEKEKGKKS